MMTALLRTVLVYFAVIAAMRLMGKRQLGELQPAELVTALLISNVASICIEEPDLPLLASLTAIFLIAALEILNSSLTFYFPRYAQLLFGKPVTVVRNGRVDERALSYLRISAADLAEALRGKDVFDPGEAAWAVIETNGTLSVAPAPAPGAPPPMLPVLIGGHLYRDTLKALGKDEAWLDEALAARALTRGDVLMLLHNGRTAYLSVKEKRPGGKAGAKEPDKGGGEGTA